MTTHHHPPYHIAGTHVARITNYPSGTGRNHDGSEYGGNRIAADWSIYPPHTVIAFFLHGRVVTTRVCDTGPAIRGPRHFDFPTRLLGLGSRGTATGVRFWVVRRGDGRPVIRVGRGRSLEERRFGREVLGHRHRRPYRIRRRRHPRGHYREVVRDRHARGHWHEHVPHNRCGRGERWDRVRHAEHFRRTERVRLVHRHGRHHRHHRHHHRSHS